MILRTPRKLGRKAGLYTLWSMLSLLGFTGCYSTRPPSAAIPGLYSTTTGLQNLTAEFGNSRSLFDDYQVVTYLAASCAPDTSFVLTMDWGVLKKVPHALPIGMPGLILLTKDGLGIDESEVPNIEWKRYQQQLVKAGSDIRPTLLAVQHLPVADYFSNPFYDYCPVVGVSYEQVVAFCKWRGRVVQNAFNRSNKLTPADSLSPEYVRYECRLPTEAEWEMAALARRPAQPYGTRCAELPLRVNPAAAAYLKQRAGSSEPVEKIKSDIVVYNRTHPVRSPIAYAQSEPAFLQLAAPGYIYQGPTNDHHIFNLLGNVAEMVQERGLAKGGSYRDPLSACTTTAQSRYTSPEPFVGFRCVGRATRPNRP
jgi:formylglycine-generating enzyme required for sulfatase activity